MFQIDVARFGVVSSNRLIGSELPIPLVEPQQIHAQFAAS